MCIWIPSCSASWGRPVAPARKSGERAAVAGQVVHGFHLRGVVLLGQADRVVDEEADVVAPQARPVEELLRGLVAVDGADRLRELDAVRVEGRRGGLEVLVAVEALLGGGDREQGVLAEQGVERDAEVGGRAGRCDFRHAVGHSVGRPGLRGRRGLGRIIVAVAATGDERERGGHDDGEECEWCSDAHRVSNVGVVGRRLFAPPARPVRAKPRDPRRRMDTRCVVWPSLSHLPPSSSRPAVKRTRRTGRPRTGPARVAARSSRSPSASSLSSRPRSRLDPGSYTFHVVNDGSVVHAFEVEGPSGEVETADLEPGASADLEVELSEAGEYEIYCPVDGHRDQGMEGTITVGGGGGGGTTTDETTTEDDGGYDYGY